MAGRGVWVLAWGLVGLGCLPSPFGCRILNNPVQFCFCCLALNKKKQKTNDDDDGGLRPSILRRQFDGEPEGSLGGLEWREPSFLTMLCSCYLSDDETFALGDGGLKG